jgi:hypothetical protein
VVIVGIFDFDPSVCLRQLFACFTFLNYFTHVDPPKKSSISVCTCK